jgi:hypothetical protein
MTAWWFNNKTHEVEEGPQSPGADRDGPFATREDAARARKSSQNAPVVGLRKTRPKTADRAGLRPGGLRPCAPREPRRTD